VPLVAVATVLMAAPATNVALTGAPADLLLGEGQDGTSMEPVTARGNAAITSQMLAEREQLAKEKTSRQRAIERTRRLRELAEQRREARQRAARERAERMMKRWVLPILNFDITAGFGETSSLWSTTHTGLDFAADYGTPVRSVGTGEVISAGWDGSYGYKIAIRHWDGTVTWYCHLSEIFRSSGTVEPGETIGSVGDTGNVTGPHLHLEVRPYGGDPIDPMWWLSQRGVL
jgi:murein DD-endopeptidase MepM/ murein hydrolase activator NlpD